MVAASQKKIADEELSVIANHFKKWMVLIGATNLQTEDEFRFTVESFKKTFPFFTLAEFDYAFDLALKGMINFVLYNKQISLSYVSEIIKAYKDWRKNQPEYKTMRKVEVKEKSEKEIYDFMAKAVERSFEEFKKGNYEYIKFHIYDWLTKNEILYTTPERKREFYKKAQQEIKDELQKQKALLINPLDRIRLTETVKTKEINRAKELNLKNFYEGLYEMGIEINEYLKN